VGRFRRLKRSPNWKRYLPFSVESSRSSGRLHGNSIFRRREGLSSIAHDATPTGQAIDSPCCSCVPTRLQLGVSTVGLRGPTSSFGKAPSRIGDVLLREVGLVLTIHSAKCFSGQDGSDIATVSSTALPCSGTGKRWELKAEVVSKLYYVAHCV
jgi:hypothetical protein